MTVLGLSEAGLRFGIFIVILVAMTGLETWLPRRARRHRRLRRWPTNFAVLVASFLAISLVTLVVPITATLAALWAEDAGVGLFNNIGLPVWLEWIIAFVLIDFVIWGQHLTFHKIPILWRVHRVHHTDEDIDASTAVRFHPVEIVISLFVKSGAAVLIGAPPVIVLISEVTINGAAMFNHANLKLPVWLDRALRLVLVTPDMHRVHHSTENRETSSNFGFALPWWDWLFRTYVAQPEKGHDDMVVGLADWQDDAPTRLGWTLALPFTNPARSARVSVETDREPA